jgi:hypothetical protein
MVKAVILAGTTAVTMTWTAEAGTAVAMVDFYLDATSKCEHEVTGTGTSMVVQLHVGRDAFLWDIANQGYQAANPCGPQTVILCGYRKTEEEVNGQRVEVYKADTGLFERCTTTSTNINTVPDDMDVPFPVASKNSSWLLCRASQKATVKVLIDEADTKCPSVLPKAALAGRQTPNGVKMHYHVIDIEIVP